MLGALRSRGLLQAVTHESIDHLVRPSGARVASVYAGFDPTADGLHVGSLVQLMALRWMRRAGLRPIALVRVACESAHARHQRVHTWDCPDPATCRWAARPA